MPCTSPNKSAEEITGVHFMCIQPLDDISFGDCLHPDYHEMLSLASAPVPGIFFEDPSIVECIHFDDTHPHVEVCMRKHTVEMIELPFSSDPKESGCPLHKHVHAESEHSEEDPKKATSPSSSEATSPSSSEPKSEEEVETAKDGGSENIASDDDTNNLSPKDPENEAGVIYTYTLQYRWSPMLKYCTMEEMGYKPLQLL